MGFFSYVRARRSAEEAVEGDGCTYSTVKYVRERESSCTYGGKEHRDRDRDRENPAQQGSKPIMLLREGDEAKNVRMIGVRYRQRKNAILHTYIH